MIDGITAKLSIGNMPTTEVKEREVRQESFSSKEVKKDVKVGMADKEKALQSEEKSESEAKVEQERLDEAVERIKTTANNLNRKLDLELEEDLNITIVKVIDKESEEVIRQIPSEELIALSKNAKDLKGLLVNREG